MPWSSKQLLNLAIGKPLVAVFEVCLRCNSACGYCDLPLNVGKPELSRDQIRRIFGDLHATGLRYVFVQGGEPLVRKDIAEVLEDLAEIGLSITLITNGTRLTASLVKRLTRIPLTLSISLDTLNRERYRRIRGADQLLQVLRGIRLLENFPHPKRLICVISEANREDALDVARFARDNGFIPIFGVYHWNVERYGKPVAELQYEKAAAIDTAKQLLDSDLIPRGLYRNFVRDNVSWLAGEFFGHCDAGRYSIAIDSAGSVSPCLAKAPVGNLLDTSLAQLLTRMDRREIHRCSSAATCNVMCSRLVATHIRKPISGLLTPNHAPPAPKEPPAVGEGIETL